MIDINSTSDIASLSESWDIECKLAAGSDGKGQLPKDFWESYSAFANTNGGEVFLGLREGAGHKFSVKGIENVEKVLSELWTGLNNKQKVSANILRESDVRVITIEGHNIIHIHVPRASRKSSPLYLNDQPIKNTFKRLHSADIRAGEVDVRRMLAEQTNDNRDSDILPNFGFEDLNQDSVISYRNIFSSLNPDHPWNQHGIPDFLKMIKAFGINRETGETGITVAGLLMFGQFTSIQDLYPYYMLDYQERPQAKTEARWIDRVTLDGTWSGNLFDFYLKVIRRLTSDLKVPFVLDGDRRIEDTVVHIALREALINTLVHADYSLRASVLIVKRPDMFGFRNPGLMRVPKEIAIQGGESDCRNRLTHQMFRLIGLGEQAGSGIPKIYEGWENQHWRQPSLTEKDTPSEQTLLAMHTLSLIPDHVLEELDIKYGEDFSGLSNNEQIVIVTAHIEKTVNHARMMQIMDIHPRDLSDMLGSLTEIGMLQSEGIGRGAIYFLHDARLDDIRLVFSELSEDQPPKPKVIQQSVTSGGTSVTSGGNACLKEIAEPIASTKRSPRDDMEATIIELCSVKPLKLEELSELLNRSGEFLRKDYVQSLIQEKRLKLKYPTMPSHPDQAYEAVIN